MHSKYLIKTIDGQEIDLTYAREIKSNNLYPFGTHNYAIYKTPEGNYVKATNKGSREIMLDTYESISEEIALNYKHPRRES